MLQARSAARRNGWLAATLRRGQPISRPVPMAPTTSSSATVRSGGSPCACCPPGPPTTRSRPSCTSWDASSSSRPGAREGRNKALAIFRPGRVSQCRSASGLGDLLEMTPRGASEPMAHEWLARSAYRKLPVAGAPRPRLDSLTDQGGGAANLPPQPSDDPIDDQKCARPTGMKEP